MLQLAPAPLAAALAADNVMALAYFPLCSYLGRDEPDPYAGPPESDGTTPGGGTTDPAATEQGGADEVSVLEALPFPSPSP